MSEAPKKLRTADKKTEQPLKKIEVKLLESPVEKALKLSSEQIIAMAIKDLIKKDEMH